MPGLLEHGQWRPRLRRRDHALSIEPDAEIGALVIHGERVVECLDRLGVLALRLELRQQALVAVAVEGSRGERLAKEKASRKIAAIVALAMACVGCLDAPARAAVTAETLLAWAESMARLETTDTVRAWTR